MSFFGRVRRAWFSEDSERPPGPEDDFWYEPLSGHGQITYRDALQIAAASAAGRAISETLGTLPLHVYRRLPGGGKELARDHRLFRTLAEQPHEDYTAVEMIEQWIQSLLFRGNCLAEYKVDSRNDVVTIEPVDWQKVSVVIDRQTGVKFFKWRDDRRGDVIRPSSEVLHIPGNAYDGVKGYGLLETASTTFGVSRRVQDYVDNHFKNMLPPVAVTFPTPMTPAARNEWYAFLRRKFTGGKAPLMVIDNGGKLESLNLKAQEMQLTEIWKQVTTQMARLFRVPPHIIGDLDRATFSNIEHEGQNFINMSLIPWARRIEQRLEMALLGPLERKSYLVRFSFDALLRGDAVARGSYYSQVFQVGGITSNEIRDHEGRNPVEGGDVPMVQGALVPLTQAGKLQEAAQNAA